MPTTSEVLWGVINGDILSTLWQKITANTDSLLSLGPVSYTHLDVYKRQPVSMLNLQALSSYFMFMSS